MENAISILVASEQKEDRSLILDILSEQAGFRVVSVEKDETGAIIRSERLKPDVLVLDLQLSQISAPELARIIHRKSPSTVIIMLCDKDEAAYTGLALNAGICGFLLKNADMDKLVPVVKIVFSGGYYISASIIVRVFSSVALLSRLPGRIIERHSVIFSPTECGIITDIALGFSDEQIAKHLHFSTGTIRNCLSAIKRKTKLKNRVQIVLFSLVYGLINPETLDFYKNDRQIPNDTIQ